MDGEHRPPVAPDGSVNRAVVKREYSRAYGGSWRETLECGHVVYRLRTTSWGRTVAAKRRCGECPRPSQPFTGPPSSS